jgi:hypothetical protein
MKKRMYLSTFLILAIIQAYSLNVTLCAQESDNSRTSQIHGKVLDAQDKPVDGSVVILCDQKRGSPICKDTFHLLTDASINRESNSRNLLFSVTNQQGEFAFENIPAGEYRLIAQTWKDAEEIKDVFEKNGEIIELNGIAENIKAESEKIVKVEIHPLGTGGLRIDEDLPNSETLLVISTKPTRADPILGFTGWGGDFVKNMIGGNRMPYGRTTVLGLPEGTTYVAMFASDSVPGWLDGKAEIKSNATIKLDYIPFVNSWSDSRHDPPEELLPVFEEAREIAETNTQFILKLYQDIGIDANSGLFGLMSKLGPHLKEELVLPSGRKTTVGDFFAAIYYVKLQQIIQRREEQIKQQKETSQEEANLEQFSKATCKKASTDLDKDRIYVEAYTGSLGWLIERVGVVPDFPVVQSAEGPAKGCYPVLEDAKKYLVEQTKK